MDMLRGEQIAAAELTDWRKLAQGLHARYLIDGFTAGARFVTAVGEAGDEIGHHPTVRIGDGYVDLELVTDDAIYRGDDGTELVIEWVTQQDVDLARRITEIAAEHGLTADPAAVSELEIGVDTTDSTAIAPMWAALLTGDPGAQGRGTPGDEIRDLTRRLPNLWFGDSDGSAAQRFHVEVYVAPEVVEQRIAAAVAAGGKVVDDSESPGLTVIADAEGNRGVICADTSAQRD
ncbi:4a-hydroxytetrahydrobiopterin dehydratase [Flexivirga sp. ID2601S]|uniref:Putative pterin-4-alpha-carbinolamine dehydratase n=1 Tax=Flexivirga aerilata TaxID=1656889 RepID=A0A849AEG0_9MICO|nr:VOC family protein [Flexivirga aerilata]NNG38297.1 4a-hydroxytetrahydrobiopterin dehydratase [Flexivirga aerilata]